MKNKCFAVAATAMMVFASNSALANLITNGDFESGGLTASPNTITGTSGPYGQWLAFSGHWDISSGVANNITNYAENPDPNYILMQGIDLSSYSSSFETILSFDYAYEGGYGGIDGRGVRVFGMDAGDSVSLFFMGSTFNSVNDDLLFSHELSLTGNPTNDFSPYTSSAFTIDPTQYSALLVVYTFGGDPANGYLRAVDNVSLSGPTNVPEPGTLALFGLGLLGLGFSRRKLN